MKNVITSIQKTCLLAAVISTASAAMASDGGFYVTETLGIHLPSKSTPYGNSVAANIGVGMKTDSPWATELTYTIAAPSEDKTDGNAIFRHVHLDALYYIEQEAKLRPYAAFGMGKGSLTDSNGKVKNNSVNFGAGFDWELMPRLDLRGDARFLVDSDSSNTDAILSLGIAYRFFDLVKASTITSSPKSTVIMSPADGDKDGVFDRNDRCPDTSANASVDEFGCEIVAAPVSNPAPAVVPDLVPSEVSITLAVQFANNSSVVASNYLEEIRAVATFMKKYPETTVVVEGHTDSTGKDDYNQWLSARRAQSVAKLLVATFGVDSDRVSSKGFGESQPVASNETAAGKEQNRRVVAVISTFEK